MTVCVTVICYVPVSCVAYCNCLFVVVFLFILTLIMGWEHRYCIQSCPGRTNCTHTTHTLGSSVTWFEISVTAFDQGIWSSVRVQFSNSVGKAFQWKGNGTCRGKVHVEKGHSGPPESLKGHLGVAEPSKHHSGERAMSLFSGLCYLFIRIDRG